MANLPLSVFTGSKGVSPSQFGELTTFYKSKPTFGQVAEAYVDETFSGEGSLAQDLQAIDISTSEKEESAISEQEWKEGGSFRQGVTYYPTMTRYSAKVLAEAHDDRTDRQIVMDKASKLQTIGGFGLGFASGIAEPKNLVSGVAAALVTGGAGIVIPSLGRMMAVNTVRGAAGRGAIEGIAGAALTEPSNLHSSKIVQGDYDINDSMINLTLGALLGAGIGGGVKKLQLRGEAKREAYRAESASSAVKEFDTATSQLAQGSEVKVEAVKSIDDAEISTKARQELPKIEEKITAKQQETGLVPVTQRPEFKAWFEGSKVVDDTGMPKVMYHGTAKDIEEFKAGRSARGLIFFTDNPKFASDYTTSKGGSEAGGANVVPVYISANKVHKPMRWSEAQGLGAEHFKDRGYDAVKIIDDGGVETLAVVKPTQIKSIFNRGKFDPNDPRLIDAERLQVKKGQALADANKQIDQSPIKNLQEQIAKPDNSTAYDADAAANIQKYLDDAGTMEDQIRMEQEFEQFKEELAELNNQGLLNQEELNLLEKLADIDQQSSIFDNVLLNAKICLTRG